MAPKHPAQPSGQLSLTQLFARPNTVAVRPTDDSMRAVEDRDSNSKAAEAQHSTPIALDDHSSHPNQPHKVSPAFEQGAGVAASTSPPAPLTQAAKELTPSTTKLPRRDSYARAREHPSMAEEHGESRAPYRCAPGKPACPHGLSCYRKNPQHFVERDHPPDHPLILAGGSHPEQRASKRHRDEQTPPASRAAVPPPNTIEVDDDTLGKDVGQDRTLSFSHSSKDSGLMEAASDSHPGEWGVKTNEDGSSKHAGTSGTTTSHDGPPASLPRKYDGSERELWAATLRAAFLVPFSEDFFSLAGICLKLLPKAPTKALRPAGLQPLAPFRLLLGELAGGSPLTDRGPHDPPEFQPLLCLLEGSENSHVVGYWRDDPEDTEPLVVRRASMAPREGPGVTFTVIGDNLLAAIHFLLSREAAGGTMRAGECQRVCGMIAAASAECGQSIEGGGEKCKAALSRRKKVVGKTSNKMGIVVPYDKDSEVGYRDLHLGGAELRQLLRSLVNAKDGARASFQADLDDLVNWANIANDECDFGASLRLGMDLFNHSPTLAPLAARVLKTAYTLLDREPFSVIATQHAKVRNPR